MMNLSIMFTQRHLWLLALLILPLAGWAQKPFAEGVITYRVKLTPPNDAADRAIQTGTFTVFIKDHFVRRDLKMGSGFQSSFLVDEAAGTTYSLQKTPTRQYAIKLTPQRIADRQERFAGYKLDDEKPIKVGGNPCQQATVTYKDGTKESICYSKAWKLLQDNIFDRFPGLQSIPVVYDFHTSNGSLLHFEVERISQEPIESAQFRVPQGYQIISENEQQELGNN